MKLQALLCVVGSLGCAAGTQAGIPASTIDDKAASGEEAWQSSAKKSKAGSPTTETESGGMRTPRNLRLLRVGLFVGVFAAAGLGNSNGAVAQPATAALHQTGKPRPIKDLPRRVPSKNGAATLYADYATASGEQIQLYLVNRSKHALRLPAQDGVLNIKLQAHVPKRGWARAQRHVYSSCGNSYHDITIKPGQFVRIPHWFPTRGSKTRVRYRLADAGNAATNIASNEGAGWYHPDEAEQARLDALAMNTATAAQIREVLLTKATRKNLSKATPASRWETQSTRDAAIRRIAQLPNSAAVALAEQVATSPLLDPNEYNRVINVFAKVGPDQLAAHIQHTLASPPSKVRQRLLRELPFVPRLKNAALLADLIKRARVPASQDVSFILDHIAGHQTNDVEALLIAIQSDASYPRATRILARYNHEQWFGKRLVDLRIKTPGNWSDGHPRPVYLDITIINVSGKTLSFAYHDPVEVLSLYLSRSSGREKLLIPPKPGVAWFARPSKTPTTRVSLAIGKSHVVRVAVEDYFDLSPPLGHVSVWVSFRLPGLQSVARLGGGGAGINPK